MARRATDGADTAVTAGAAEPVEEEGGRRIIALLADEVLPMLIARLEQSELGELEVRENGWRVRLRRPLPGDNGVAPPNRAAPRRTDTGRSAPPRPAGAARPPHDAGQQPVRPDAKRGLVTSPAVGYYVALDGMAVGTTLEAGDLVGHIDVLGVRQDVVSTDGGVLRRFEVEPGQAVEYGQPIAGVEPDKKG